MQFDSFLFLIFFIGVLSLYYLLPSWRLQKLLLLLSSYLFYAAWSPPLVILIWASTLADFYLAGKIHQTTSLVSRKILLITSLVANLGLLGYFKYAQFLMDSFKEVIAPLGITYIPPELDIILPIGISFYTFQTLSYTIDIYRGNLKPANSFLDFALYVTFFPQLVAGPIVRASHFLPQCLQPKRATAEAFFWGLSLFIFGLFAKLVLADLTLAPVVDQVYSDPKGFGWYDSWLAVFAFSGQIYFDFAGYSLCAIGSAMCFGFHLPDNFRAPYAALGFSDFWGRWHISLSGWLRDYLYVSLGGNRRGASRTLINLGATMFLGGLWHGAAWTFVIWGWLHGLFLVGEHTVRRTFGSLPPHPMTRMVLMLGTFLAISLAWIPFRAQNIKALQEMTAGLFRTDFVNKLPASATASVLIVVVSMLLGHIWIRETTLEEAISRVPPLVRATVFGALLVSIVLSSTGDSRAFIYFQF
jgi:alginate O-acetyltransferase complex protein AlgI